MVRAAKVTGAGGSTGAAGSAVVLGLSVTFDGSAAGSVVLTGGESEAELFAFDVPADVGGSQVFTFGGGGIATGGNLAVELVGGAVSASVWWME